MILPHISVVSGLLLAGNNPNTLEGVLACDIENIETVYSEAELRNPMNPFFELAYESRYRPQWLWFRGRSKRDWVHKVTLGCRRKQYAPADLDRSWQPTNIAILLSETSLKFLIMTW